MLHTPDELRGAELLARVGPLLMEQGLALSSAVPAVQKALAVYERLQRPLAIRLRLRSLLVLAGYLYDHRLAEQYGEETLAALHECSGVALAARLSRWLGARAGLYLAIVWKVLQRPWLPKARRGPPVWTAVTYFVRCAMGLIGVRAVGLDAAGTAAIMKRLEPLAAAPASTSGRLSYLSCRAIMLQSLGREGDANEAVQEALREARRGRRRGMNPVEYEQLLVGLLTVDGINECYRESSQALQRAEALEALGSRHARAAALRVRMTYYLSRADIERAEECRREIDLHAIQGGRTWQVEWFAVAIEGWAGVTWSNVLMMRRALARLAELAAEVPSLAAMRDSIAYRRGQLERAVELGERFVAAHPPRSMVGWAPTYTILALAWIETGQAERALALRELARSHVSEADRAYFGMYAMLDLAYASALAVLGERERAQALTEAIFARLSAHSEHSALVLLYQHRARAARILNDKPALQEALSSMRWSAVHSGFPEAMVLADRVVEQRATRRSSPPPAAPLQPLSEASDRTAIGAYLRTLDAGAKRQRGALRLLARWVSAEDAYLFARVQDNDVQLVASLTGAPAPDGLTEQVRGALRRATPDNDVQPVASRTGAPASDGQTEQGRGALRRARDSDLPLVASRTGARAPDGQTEQGPEVLPAAPVPSTTQPDSSDDNEPSYRVILLPDVSAASGWIGAVAVNDNSLTSDEVPDNLLSDIGRVLAES